MRPSRVHLGARAVAARRIATIGGLVAGLGLVACDDGSTDASPRPRDAAARSDASGADASGSPQRDAMSTQVDAASGGDRDGGLRADARPLRPDAGATSPDAAVSPDAGEPCAGACLSWPVAGRRAADWVINNYVDLDPGGDTRDYRGNTGDDARTYNGHRGVDIDIANFRAMDRGVDVIAATPGRVRRTVDDQMDRNTSCISRVWNVVEVDGDDGHRYYYGHLKRSSVVVSVGDRVTTGQKLAEVGSSGCSTAAHLHFEIRTSQGTTVDPFLDGLWVAPPAYDAPYGIMELSLASGGYSSVNQIKDPGTNLATAAAGDRVGVGVSSADGLVGERLELELVDPTGAVARSWGNTRRRAGRHSYWYWNVTLPDTVGAWRVIGRTPTDTATITFQVTR